MESEDYPTPTSQQDDQMELSNQWEKQTQRKRIFKISKKICVHRFIQVTEV